MRYGLTVGLISALMAIMVTVYFVPSIDDFRVDNPFWNGMSIVAGRLNLTLIEDLSMLSRIDDASSYALLIIGPSKPFMPEHIEFIRDFLVRGGLLVLADDFGSGNTLLYGLGVDARFRGELLLDPLFKVKSSVLPRIRGFIDVYSGFDEIVFDYATVIDGSGFRLVASSSHFSFLDLNLNFKWDEGEPRGPFPVVVEFSFGGGRVFLISDSSFLINAIVDLYGNFNFICSILSGRRVLLCTSHWTSSFYAEFRDWIMGFLEFASIPEFKYSLLILSIMFVYRFIGIRVGGEELDLVEMILRRHPNWNRDVLLRLRGEVMGEE